MKIDCIEDLHVYKPKKLSMNEETGRYDLTDCAVLPNGRGCGCGFGYFRGNG